MAKLRYAAIEKRLQIRHSVVLFVFESLKTNQWGMSNEGIAWSYPAKPSQIDPNLFDNKYRCVSRKLKKRWKE